MRAVFTALCQTSLTYDSTNSACALAWQVSLDAEDIRNEKVKVLRNMSPISMEDVVIGQYRGRGKKQGYLDDPTVPDGRCTLLLPPSHVCRLLCHGLC